MKKAGRIPIDSLQVDYVRVKNKGASDAATAVVAVGGATAVYAGIAILITWYVLTQFGL